ncbi:hypothetical protein PY365_06365 [Roseiarcaceae bacterium H3SJ34-1]|uniref:aminotransferase class IV n=1 Tax=Terripilifer ovatus TaxID=3032367 RepID=UPI003AB965DC|nr:hypothetical protein [Roseiarcaceae bacterium H3SJ34-1]
MVESEKSRHGELGLGGGVVYDSGGASEYAECRLKGAFFEEGRRPLQLIETLRYEGGFHRLESHLSRMANSASVFGLRFDKARALNVLEEAVESHAGPLRVRLTLDEVGRHLATVSPLDTNPSRWTYRVSPVRVVSTDLLQQHKTDWREVYDGDLAETNEVIFLNERGELVVSDVLRPPTKQAADCGCCCDRGLLGM